MANLGRTPTYKEKLMGQTSPVSFKEVLLTNQYSGKSTLTNRSLQNSQSNRPRTQPNSQSNNKPQVRSHPSILRQPRVTRTTSNIGNRNNKGPLPSPFPPKPPTINEKLPDYIFLRIFEKLNFTDLQSASLVCKYWRSVILLPELESDQTEEQTGPVVRNEFKLVTFFRNIDQLVQAKQYHTVQERLKTFAKKYPKFESLCSHKLEEVKTIISNDFNVFTKMYSCLFYQNHPQCHAALIKIRGGNEVEVSDIQRICDHIKDIVTIMLTGRWQVDVQLRHAIIIVKLLERVRTFGYAGKREVAFLFGDLLIHENAEFMNFLAEEPVACLNILKKLVSYKRHISGDQDSVQKEKSVRRLTGLALALVALQKHLPLSVKKEAWTTFNSIFGAQEAKEWLVQKILAVHTTLVDQYIPIPQHFKENCTQILKSLQSSQRNILDLAETLGIPQSALQ